MSSREKIGWSQYALNSRANRLNATLNGAVVFTPQSDAGGNHRAGLKNPYVEHKKFFKEVLSGERKLKTLVNYGMLLRCQLNIEFSNRNAISSPSKKSIIDVVGQYFYREVFTSLINPITRGYKIDENRQRYSKYSFYSYVRWLYTFIHMKFLPHERAQLLMFLKEALGNLHDFFLSQVNISTTSLDIKEEFFKVRFSFAGGRSGKSRVKNVNKNVKIKKKPLEEMVIKRDEFLT